MYHDSGPWIIPLIISSPPQIPLCSVETCCAPKTPSDPGTDPTPPEPTPPAAGAFLLAPEGTLERALQESEAFQARFEETKQGTAR